MRLVVQRVKRASVRVGEKNVSEIGKGIFVLVGIHIHDMKHDAEILAERLVKLRVMQDKSGKMNLTVGDAGGSMLVVSQFTLYGNTRGANRPDFSKAASSETALPIYEYFVEKLREKGIGIDIQTGEFGEYMDIRVELDGPVTILIES